MTANDVQGPSLSLIYLRSGDGFITLAQLVFCLLSFACVHASFTCTRISGEQLCSGPDTQILQASSTLTFFVLVLIIFDYLIHTYSFPSISSHLPWRKLRFIHRGTCAVLMFLVSSISAGSARRYNLVITAAIFGFTTSLLFMYQLVREWKCPGDKSRFKVSPSENATDDVDSRMSSTMAVNFSVNGDLDGVTNSAPCLLSSIARKTSSSASLDHLQMKSESEKSKFGDNDTARLSASTSSSCSIPRGSLRLLSVDGNFQTSASELSDKRSWVIPDSLRGSDANTNALDNMSTGNYTVEVVSEG